MAWTTISGIHGYHAQKVRFANTKMVSEDGGSVPRLIKSYVHLKTVELINCIFMWKCHAGPDAVSRWLGQNIDVLERARNLYT